MNVLRVFFLVHKSERTRLTSYGCHADSDTGLLGAPANMSDESTLRKKAREAMRAGQLPSRLPSRLWGGPGVGACCTICGRPSERGELELEFAPDGDDRDRGNHHVHIHCFAAWELEYTNSGQARGTVSCGDGNGLGTPPTPAGGGTERIAVSGSLPAPSNGRMIAAHECDGTDERGSA
ncbi:MAG: hypothetical protein JWN85_2430 [Gammaproteobacteria bacterium]|jgi:hypothetical protein|nr:hypothetical protein [Gammaproteobacteria bacterium]